MGWSAAEAFYQENRDWLDSPEEAYEHLYGRSGKQAKRKNRCPICNKRMRSESGILDHLRDYHKNAKGAEAIRVLHAPQPTQEE